MCPKDDFLEWNDIDLDDILGEYTDDDFYSADDNTFSTDSEYGVICDSVVTIVSQPKEGNYLLYRLLQSYLMLN